MVLVIRCCAGGRRTSLLSVCSEASGIQGATCDLPELSGTAGLSLVQQWREHCAISFLRKRIFRRCCFGFGERMVGGVVGG